MLNFISTIFTSLQNHLYGFSDFSLWSCFLLILLTTHITILSVTIYLHRHMAHSALDLNKYVGHFFRFWLWLTTAMNTKAWVSIHRKHHAYCETEQDPHSPVQLGIKKVLTQGAEIYSEADTKETRERFGKRTPDDFIERNLYSKYRILGIVLFGVALLLLFGLNGIWMFGIQMMWIPLFAAGIINGVGHWWGYRNYECSDNARNILPVGFIIGGEELHNNHHSFPNSPKLSRRKWEFDIGWFWIKALSYVGLAKPGRTEPIYEKTDFIPQEIDHNIFMALKNRKLQLLKSYDKEVLKKTFPSLSKRKRNIILKAEKWRKEKEIIKLNELIQKDSELAKVYNYYINLVSVWGREKGENMNHQIEKLKMWCAEVEESGIEALHEFSQNLKRYRLPA